MVLLTQSQVLTLHQRIMTQSGGADGVRDVGALESAIAQPEMSYDEQDLYPTLIDKVGALGFL